MVRRALMLSITARWGLSHLQQPLCQIDKYRLHPRFPTAIHRDGHHSGGLATSQAALRSARGPLPRAAPRRAQRPCRRSEPRLRGGGLAHASLSPRSRPRSDKAARRGLGRGVRSGKPDRLVVSSHAIEVGIVQLGAGEVRSTEVRAAKACLSQIGPLQLGVPK